MSRSTRKPYVKDGNKKNRQIHHRRYRSITRQITRMYAKSYDFYDVEGRNPLPEYPHPNAITNQWDICDWNWFLWPDEDDYKRYTRK